MGAIRSAMVEIRRRRMTFEKTEKGLSSSGKTDYVTDADYAAQEVYVETFGKAFPGVGLIGEEDGLREPCTAPGEDFTLTLDPLDGTNAFVRGQSHGIATMVGILTDGKLAGGYIGDVMTGEIYAAHIGEATAWHYEADGTRKPLVPLDAPLSEQYALLRQSPKRYSRVAKRMAKAWHDDEGLFDDYLVDTGSIGLHFARLWKGEIGGFLVEDSTVTPWDQTPCYAISERMGILQIALTRGRGPHLEEYAPVSQVRSSGVEYVYLHPEGIGEFARWMRDAFPHIKLEL